MEKLGNFFIRIEADEAKRQDLFKELAGRFLFMYATAIGEEGLPVLLDGGSEWLDDVDTQPDNPLRCTILTKKSDNPYGVLKSVVAHCRTVCLGMHSPDWSGILGDAYIHQDWVGDWENAVGRPANKPESTRKIDNLLQALTCIAIDAYGHDPKSNKSTAPSDIANALSKLGKNFDQKTIRGWLKEGADLLPPIPRKD